MYELIAAFLVGAGVMAFPAHAVGFARGLRSKYRPSRPRYRRTPPGPRRGDLLPEELHG